MRILVTRPRGQSASLATALRLLGGDVIECPLIEIEPIADGPIDCAGYDWVIVTSANGANELARRAHNVGRIAAVGPGTAEALRGHGLWPAFVPVEASQEGLLRTFPRPAGRVLFAAAEGARRGPVEELGAEFIALYRTRLLTPELPEVDLVVLASASAAKAYAEAGGRCPVVSIGPETSRAAATAGLDVVAEAVVHDVDGLVAAVRDLMDSAR